MQRRIRAVDVHSPAVHLVEEVGSEERIEPAGGGSVRMDVEPGGAESVLRDVPGRRRRIEEVRHEPEQVDDQEGVRERAHHVLPSTEEEQEDDGEVLADVDEVGEAASQVERGPMVRREELVERLPRYAEPAQLEPVRAVHVHAPADCRPVEIAHGIVDGAGDDQGKEEAQEEPGLLVVQIEEPEHTEEYVVRTQPSHERDHGDVDEARARRQDAPLHRPALRAPSHADPDG